MTAFLAGELADPLAAVSEVEALAHDLAMAKADLHAAQAQTWPLKKRIEQAQAELDENPLPEFLEAVKRAEDEFRLHELHVRKLTKDVETPTAAWAAAAWDVPDDRRSGGVCATGRCWTRVGSSVQALAAVMPEPGTAPVEPPLQMRRRMGPAFQQILRWASGRKRPPALPKDAERPIQWL